MASSNKRNQSGYVDISSNSQVNKVYKKKGRAKRIIIIAFSIIFLICGSGLLYVYSFLDSFTYNHSGEITKVDNNNGNGTTTDLNIGSNDTTLTYDGKTVLSHPKVLNVMLFGEEKEKGEEHGRTDTMIMLSIDNINKKIKLTTFMRDTFVYIPGYDHGKLNSAYSFGGPALAIQTIESNFGIGIDRYAVVDYESFKKIIDILGGVDIELTEDEIGYINFQMWINDQTDTPTTITDPAGVVHLNGTEALWYARNRGFYEPEKYPGVVFSGDDWDRTRRQRNFLSTTLSSLKSASLDQIIRIAGEIGPYITTNFKKDEITTLLLNSLTYLQYDVEEFSIPNGDLGGNWQYTNDPYYGSCISIIDIDAVRNDFAKFVFEDAVTTNTSSTTE